MSIRDTILNAPDLPEELVTVPEWGGVQLLVRGLTGKGRGIFMEQAANKTIDLKRLQADLIIQTLFDPATKESVFKPEDCEALNGKSGVVLDRIFTIAQRLSGMAPDALKAAEKNSNQASEDSTLNSPGSSVVQ